MSLVLDAGVLVKLVLEKKGSAETRRLIRSAILSGLEIHESDLALSEALNTIWRHTCLVRDLKGEEGRDAALDLLKLWSKLEIHPAERLASEALDLAFGEKVTFYDSVYLALARSLNATLVTFDGIMRGEGKEAGDRDRTSDHTMISSQKT